MRTINAFLSSALLIVALALPVAAARADDIVKVDGGQLSGTASADGTVRIFKGIPFAKPPVGDLRWKAPQPATPWQGVRKAAAFGPGCMQGAPQDGYKLLVSEDCLYLNVWTGAKAATEKRPVIVWIHGGGFTGGSTSNPFYDGENLAKEGVVFVSVEYRVGRFGFLAHPELTKESDHHASGNYGLMDQIAGLQWVKKNIAAFGGNPEEVTLMGQSAGSYSVSYLMASPLAKGLFKRAIGESGGGFGPISARRSENYLEQKLADAERFGVAFARSLGAANLAALRAKTAAEILAAPPTGSKSNTQVPVIDGYVLPDSPYNIFTAGKQNDVALLTGSNSDEGAGGGRPMRPREYTDDASGIFGPQAAAYLKLYPGTTPEQVLRSEQDTNRDRSFGWQNWTWANLEAKTGHQKVYYYYFEHAPPLTPGSVVMGHTVDQSGSLGAFHTSEILYVFHDIDARKAPWKPADHKLSDEMSAYWVNFVKTGNPNGKELPNWQAFDREKPMALHIGDDIKMGPVTNKDKYGFWDTYFQTLL